MAGSIPRTLEFRALEMGVTELKSSDVVWNRVRVVKFSGRN